MGRILATARKIGLADVIEGWNDCYLVFRPIGPDVTKMIGDFDDKNASDDDGVDMIYAVLERLFVAGKVKAYTEDFELETVDAVSEDIRMLDIKYATHLFAVLNGGKYADPKDSLPEAETTSEPESTATGSDS